MISFGCKALFIKILPVLFVCSACMVQPIQRDPASVNSLSSSPVLPIQKPETAPVTFTASDGTILDGTLYGAGKTGIIFSAMGAQRQETWAKMAQTAAEQGYLTMTYNYRFWVTPTKRDESLYQYSIDDLRAAIEFARQQGVTKLVLIGASWGGMLSAKLAASEDVQAIIIMASPLEAKIDGRITRVEASELQAIHVPKLFLSAEDDQTVPLPNTRRMYALAAEPKEFLTIPGTAHGTDNFEMETGTQLSELMLTFLLANVPPFND